MKSNSFLAVGPGVYREDSGMVYEDFVPDEVVEHRPGRTITMTDNVWSSLLCHNQHPLHIDAVYAEQTQFGKILVSSLVTFGIVNGMTVSTISAKCVANLGWDKVRLTAPVFVGDTLYAQTRVVSRRESATRPDQGIVTVRTVGRNQDDVPVIEFERTILVPRQEADR